MGRDVTIILIQTAIRLRHWLLIRIEVFSPLPSTKTKELIVKIWSFEDGELIHEIDLTDQFKSMNKLTTYNLDIFAIRILYFTPDGLLIVIADDGRMHFVDLRSGEWLGAASSNLQSADQIIPLNYGASFAIATRFYGTSGFNYFPEFTGVIPIWGIEPSSISP